MKIPSGANITDFMFACSLTEDYEKAMVDMNIEAVSLKAFLIGKMGFTEANANSYIEDVTAHIANKFENAASSVKFKRFLNKEISYEDLLNKNFE